MAIVDHVAIFLMGSLDQPKAGKAKPDRPSFWAQLAFPASAEADLLAACTEAAPGNNLAGQFVPIKRHSAHLPDKQFPGIPQDAFIVRVSSGPDFPPELFGTDGKRIAALPINGSQIRSEFFSGQRVRVNTYAYAYPSKNGGQPGIGLNLSGIMAVGGGERLAIGNSGEDSATAFAKYGATPDSAPAHQSAPAQTPQSAPADGGNPFQQGSGSAANPFG